MSDSCTRPRRIVWSGATTGGFGWLRSRISQTHQIIELPAERDCVNRLDGVERMVFASQDRLSLPPPDWQKFNIPIAIATDAWWEGSSRTGLRELNTPAIPWYRWWDGWRGWLTGSSSRLFGPFPTRIVHCELSRPPSDAKCSSMELAPTHGWIITHCFQAADAWAKIAEPLGASVTWLTPPQFWQHVTNHGVESQQSGASPNWLVWDDAGSDSDPHVTASSLGYEHCGEIFRSASELLPEALLLASLTMPRWSIWREAQHNGAQELIAKPNAASCLLPILSNYLQPDHG